MKDFDSKQLDLVVACMRKNGIVQLSYDGLKIFLGPQPILQDEELASKPAKDVEEPRRGRDGLTKEEQEDWYNRPMDAGL